MSLIFKPRVTFLEAHGNLISVGGKGTGKTDLAIAIAPNLVRGRSRARFFNIVDLANELEQENMAGRGGRLTATNNSNEKVFVRTFKE